MRFVRVFLFALVGLTTACRGASVCGAHSEQLYQEDGGIFRCTLPDDCPRPANTFVCVTDVLTDKECVSCDNTRCVRTIPEFCQ